jgi:hypothetical protein
VGRSVLHSDLCAGADAVVSYETIADTMVRHGPNYGENFTGSRCVRHEPTALNMCHSFADQPPRRFPRAILSLTGDALNPALFADIVIPERDEPARRRHLNTEELSAAACAPAWRGRAAQIRAAKATAAPCGCCFCLLAFASRLPFRSPILCAASTRTTTRRSDFLVLETPMLH